MTPALRSSRVRALRRGQGGATLIELLLAVTASAVILVPTLAWAALALDQQPRTEDGLVRSADTGLLGAYLPEDVAVSGAAAVAADAPVDADAVPVNFEDCIGGAGDGGRVVLALLISGDPVQRTLYTEAVSADGDGRSVWRRTCDQAGAGTESVEVFDDVVAGATQVVCDDGSDDGDCRQVSFRTAARSGGVPVVMSATRRADSASLRVDRTGNRLPVAKIGVLAQGIGLPFQVTFSAAGSYDPDGGELTYRWTFPTLPEGAAGAPAPQTVSGDGTTIGDPQVRSFSQLGRYYVTLTVTDADGATNTTYKRITADPQAPTAVAQLTPTVGTAGETTFTFTGSGSTDADGSVVAWSWRLGGEEPLGGVAYVRTEADWSTVFPVYVTGAIPVVLTVTDADGRTDTFVTSIQVNPPGPVAPPAGEETPPPPPTTVPGGPQPVFTTSVASGTTLSFDATGTTDDGTVVGYDWDFGDGTTGSGATATHAYPGPGTYTARLTATDDVGLVGTVSQSVVVPGTPPTPPAPTQSSFDLVWAPVPGVRRYLVDFEFTGNGCARSITDQAVGAGPAPAKAIPPNLCPGATSTARARYAVDVSGQVVWSPWADISTPDVAGGPGEVVK